MTYLPKLIRDEITKKVFWALVALVGGFGVWIVGRGEKTVAVPLWAVGAVGALGIGAWLAYSIRQRTSYVSYRYPKIRHQFVVLEKRISYKIDAERGLLFSRTIKLKSKIDGLDRHTDKFLWTGGQASLPAADVGCVATQEWNRAGVWTFYTTQLDRTLNRGDIHEFTVKWALQNWRDSRPFVSSSTDEPTKKIVFELDLTQAQVTSGLIAEHLRAIEAANPFLSSEYKLDAGRFTWDVKRPRLYQHYRLRWQWSGFGEPEVLPTVE